LVHRVRVEMGQANNDGSRGEPESETANKEENFHDVLEDLGLSGAEENIDEVRSASNTTDLTKKIPFRD
jgi:hypothetical protein